MLSNVETQPITPAQDISNSDFDVDILADLFVEPNIPLKFPLPTDKETYIDIPGNVKSVSQSFNILHLALRLVTGANFYDKIYSVQEYRYFTNKHSPEFKKKFPDYMNNKLEREDTKLDEIVYDLINQELNLKLITADQFKDRFQKVKDYMVKFYKQENERNLPNFTEHNFLRSAYVTVLYLMRKLFPKGIWVSNDDISRLYQKYLQDPMSIVFLPSHQSHLDYIIIHVICIRFQMSTPVVIAGDNLNVTVLGGLLQNFGAIFIPRSFNNELYTERNLNNVMEFFLLNKVPFEVFIEGTRSRDGKLLLPKYGILKSLCAIYDKQKNEDHNESFDLLFQPVATTYERVYENDAFLKELKGDDKKKESFLSTLSVGASAFFVKDDVVTYDKDGWNDNSERTLTGKIFVKFGDSFKISEFLDSQSEIEKEMTDGVNLKRLGFKILHEVNRNSYLPEVSIVGASIQAYHDFTKKDVFAISDLIPVLRIVVQALLRENENSVTNSKILDDMLVCSDAKLEALVKDQVFSFFRLIKVNKKTNQIKIESPIELLYYKNLTIHLIIKRCLVMYILLLLDGCPNCNHRVVGKIFYILTGFLKNEFLFDYDDNERNELSFILNDLVELQVVSKKEEDYQDSVYKITDHQYVTLFANLAQPFLESYVVLISNILEMTNNLADSYARNKQQRTHDKIVVDDDELRYPTTKGLLKYIIDKSKKTQQFQSLESINKQYLVSDLYYLNNLKLVKIFKNKAKTKAFVQILNLRDLSVLNEFLNQLLQQGTRKKNMLTNEINVNYIIDITDKNFDRDYDDLRRAKL
jgi:hypothetical protein